MAGADRIIADEGALVGSIGVIMGNWVYYDDPVALDGGLFGGGVETRGGIRAIPLTAGEGKDFGNPFREPGAEELAVIQASLDESYDVFRAHVAEARGLSEEAVRELGAMIYAPRQAQAAGLIDEVADFDAALAALAEAAAQRRVADSLRQELKKAMKGAGGGAQQQQQQQQQPSRAVDRQGPSGGEGEAQADHEADQVL